MDEFSSFSGGQCDGPGCPAAPRGEKEEEGSPLGGGTLCIALLLPTCNWIPSVGWCENRLAPPGPLGAPVEKVSRHAPLVSWSRFARPAVEICRTRSVMVPANEGLRWRDSARPRILPAGIVAVGSPSILTLAPLPAMRSA